jgi:hypothetical protein
MSRIKSDNINKSNIRNLEKICKKIEKKENEMGGIIRHQPINKNFFVLSSHGSDLYSDFTVPKGVRIILFCYSGRELYVRDNFDRFIWNKIMFKKNTSFNYCTFLSNLSMYPSFRDHFCIYNQGDKFHDLRIETDKYFMDGLFQLPVEAVVLHPGKNFVFASFHDRDKLKKIKETFYPDKHYRISLEKTTELIRKKIYEDHEMHDDDEYYEDHGQSKDYQQYEEQPYEESYEEEEQPYEESQESYEGAEEEEQPYEGAEEEQPYEEDDRHEHDEKNEEQENPLKYHFLSNYWSTDELHRKIGGNKLLLSKIISKMQSTIKGSFTILLLTCRLGKEIVTVPFAKRVKEEIEQKFLNKF